MFSKQRLLLATVICLSITKFVRPLTWDGDSLKATHFWDCSGMSCDARTLQPWDSVKYVASPGYAPQDPNDFNGTSEYNEKMWLVAAASDELARIMGADSSCCGSSDEGGCGKCLLIENPEAVNSNWRAIVMKKNRCPPESNGCEAGKAHLDIAVPGFDNLQYSTANTCSERDVDQFASKAQSATLGEWYNSYSNTADAGAALCSKLPSAYVAGCNLFSQWGWKTGNPSSIRYKAVACPDAFVQHISGLFDKNGTTVSDSTIIADTTLDSGTISTTTIDSGTTVSDSTIIADTTLISGLFDKNSTVSFSKFQDSKGIMLLALLTMIVTQMSV